MMLQKLNNVSQKIGLMTNSIMPILTNGTLINTKITAEKNIKNCVINEGAPRQSRVEDKNQRINWK